MISGCSKVSSLAFSRYFGFTDSGVVGRRNHWQVFGYMMATGSCDYFLFKVAF